MDESKKPINERGAGEELYLVSIPTGTIWSLTFYVYASYEEEALNEVIAYMQANEFRANLYDIDEVDIDEEYFDEEYLYIDATAYGAFKPVYLYQPYNLRIEKINNN